MVFVHDTLQLTATHCNTPQHTTTHCNTLQHTATHCNTLFSRLLQATIFSAWHTSTHCNPLQPTATHCNTLQHTTTRCLLARDRQRFSVHGKVIESQTLTFGWVIDRQIIGHSRCIQVRACLCKRGIYVYTYIRTCMHTYMHTYVHTSANRWRF